jgi:hypothetical protein
MLELKRKEELMANEKTQSSREGARRRAVSTSTRKQWPKKSPSNSGSAFQQTCRTTTGEYTASPKTAGANQRSKRHPNKEVTQEFLDRRAIPEPHTKSCCVNWSTSRTGKPSCAKQANGIAVSEEIPYGVAKISLRETNEQNEGS